MEDYKLNVPEKNDTETIKPDSESSINNNQRIFQFIRECTSIHPERYNTPAICDCAGTYTYAEMFEQWERYARVFTALNITGENHSRVALIGTISAEPLFAFYGLNMVGTCVSMLSYANLMPGGQWRTLVEKEHITDMVISDIMVSPQMWAELKAAQNELSLRNIILLHTRMGGPCLGYAEMLFNEFNYNALRRIPGIMLMDELFEKYNDVQLKPAQKDGSQLAVICHTSGTTEGRGKPLPYTDSMVIGITGHAVDNPLLSDAEHAQSGRRVVLPFDFSSPMSINGLVSGSFVQGGTIVLTFLGLMHPKFVNVFRYYGVESAFTSGLMVEKWMQNKMLRNDTFASVKALAFGGSYVPPDKMRKYTDFLRAHGFKGTLHRGYGMSELGALYLLAPEDSEEDILGYPSDVEAFRIQDESDGKFYKTTEGPRTGILYGNSPSMCMNKLDNELLFELTEIDGKGFLCTNDAVRVNEDGSLSYAGRANRFFANHAGVRFAAGEAETLLSAHPSIEICAFVPVMDKRIHDTVPVLYAVPAKKGTDAPRKICAAIEDVFVKGDRLSGSVLPSQFILVDSIPSNANGKADVYQITRNRLKGTAYNIIPVKDGDTVTGVQYEQSEELNSYMGGSLPEGMGGDSGFRVLDMFNGTSDVPHTTQTQNAKPTAQTQNFFPTMFPVFPVGGWNFMGWFGIPQPQSNFLKLMFPMAPMSPTGWFGMPQPQQLQELQQLLKKLLETYGSQKFQGTAKAPNGIPTELLQFLMNLNSDPEDMVRFQNLLDCIFNAYFSARTSKEAKQNKL